METNAYMNGIHMRIMSKFTMILPRNSGKKINVLQNLRQIIYAMDNDLVPLKIQEIVSNEY